MFISFHFIFHSAHKDSFSTPICLSVILMDFRITIYCNETKQISRPGVSVGVEVIKVKMAAAAMQLKPHPFIKRFRALIVQMWVPFWLFWPLHGLPWSWHTTMSRMDFCIWLSDHAPARTICTWSLSLSLYIIFKELHCFNTFGWAKANLESAV